MAKLSLFRGTSSQVNARSVIDGQLLVDESTPSLYTDVGNSRLLLSQSGPKPQSDWTQSDSSSADYIKNKPTKLSQFNSKYVVYDTTEPTENLVDDKTRWYGGDGRVVLTFLNRDGSVYKEMLKEPGTSFPSIDYPASESYRINGWIPSLPSVVPSTNQTYQIDISNKVTLTFMGYEIPQSQYDYHEVYDETVVYEGDPFPVPTGSPTASPSSPLYDKLQPVFVKWKEFPQVVPANDTIYKSEWKNYTSFGFFAVYKVEGGLAYGVNLYPYEPYPSDYIQYKGYSGVALEPFTPPDTITDHQGNTYHFNNRWLTDEDLQAAIGEPTWIAPSLMDQYEINPYAGPGGDFFYFPDYRPNE